MEATTLVLSRRGQALRHFSITERPIAVGCSSRCDIVVHDENVPEHAYLIYPKDAALRVCPLDQTQRRRTFSFKEGATLRLGEHHALHWMSANTNTNANTTRLKPRCSHGDAYLRVPHGKSHQKVPIRSRPIAIGSAESNDIVLDDPTVSAWHCRIEAANGHVIVRDLGSRNGTWVGGTRIDQGEIRAGTCLRVGRTDIQLVAKKSASNAHSNSSLSSSSDGAASMVVRSTKMKQVIEEARVFSDLSFPVLIHGESGVGKEKIARMLHDEGRRKSGPYVTLNAGSLPRDLIESELFGHVQGAFTGATTGHRGVFEQAHQGTLFLDEIGELAMDLQSRLLRVLETWEVRPVGGDNVRAVDVRLVCATHRDLRDMVRRGLFREDLYYRIHQLLLHVPPLRQRTRDVPPLVTHFLAKIEPEMGPRQFTEDAVARLQTYPWPGNVRELRNVVLSAAAASRPNGIVQLQDIEAALLRVGGDIHRVRQTIDPHEALAQCDGNLSAAARSLGIPRSTLRDWLKKTS